MDISCIKKPTLLLNEEKVVKNIIFMADKARNSGVSFRPHFKTHQSAFVGELFRSEGVSKITVSSVTMCKYFMEKGWDDITIAFPANPAEIDDINSIAKKINLNILITDFEQLSSFAWDITSDVGVYVKIDTGYRRSGIDWNKYGDLARIVDLITEIKHLRIVGILTHSGHTYAATGADEVLSIFNDTMSKMLHTKEILSIPGLEISIGDTPSCKLATNFSGIDEIRPGNFVFYDMMQEKIGACSMEEIAVAVACPVVSVNHHQKEAIIYGGAVHLSKEFILNSDGSRNFGHVVSLGNSGWDTDSTIGYIRAISQEHGIVSLSDKNKSPRPGTILAVLPIHSCLTNDLLRSYTTLEGGVITDFSDK